MARSHALLLCSMWGNEDFLRLHSEAQRQFVVLLTQPSVNLAGSLPYQPSRWAQYATDGSRGQVVRSVKELESGGFVVVDYGSEEVLVRSFIRHERVLAIPNVARGMVKAARGLSAPLWPVWLRELHRLHADQPTLRGWVVPEVKELLAEPFEEPLPEPFGERLAEPMPLHQTPISPDTTNQSGLSSSSASTQRLGA